ncbi:hypothetical protein L4X63_19000 [Geomonas sp. Red32]|uniref:disulfide isomerase DsbC N-terminal domain-containing protein n=1 Tax=Geomonas sp. Red32 TaxID=2912856 RepID=UPI00202D078B|nr:disulfide isomerase DsbC N-terminal domain-containing protein [Geomonas sp. Red32]MCM0083679.1 hypothetical protein [Geomonas sp. Red32]
MFRKLLTVVVVSLALAACSQAPTKEEVTGAVKKIIPMQFEVLQVTQLQEIPALYQVVIRVNNQPVVLYVDKKAQYIVSGSVLALDKKVNLTAEVQKQYLQQKK